MAVSCVGWSETSPTVIAVSGGSVPPHWAVVEWMNDSKRSVMVEWDGQRPGSRLMGERRQGMWTFLLEPEVVRTGLYVQRWRRSGKHFWCLNYYVGLCNETLGTNEDNILYQPHLQMLVWFNILSEQSLLWL